MIENQYADVRDTVELLKWSFVFKNQEHCDPDNPADVHSGDGWDHTASPLE